MRSTGADAVVMFHTAAGGHSGHGVAAAAAGAPNKYSFKEMKPRECCRVISCKGA
jgi:hypothetical protein